MRVFFGVCCILLIGCDQAQAADRRFLISFAPPSLTAGEFISHFKLDIDGATVLSACHIPYGWRVTAGMYDSNSGMLEGEGGLGGSLISKKSDNFGQLNNLALIELADGVDRPKLEGTIEVGRYGADDHGGRKVRLNPSLLKLSSATECPPARP